MARALESGTVVKKYALGPLVGVGGMGMVHRATAEGEPGPLAVKQLRSELMTDPEMVQRFEAEIRVGQVLDHPNISCVLDDGVTPAGAPFFVMAWVEGEPLGIRIALREATPIRDSIQIAMFILDALAHAHDRGVVHGDVKADNVLVCGSGETMQVTLIDWGIARFVDQRAQRAPIRTDVVSGTPGYMAPEVLRGELPTAASDLYGVGVILYELVTGQPAFGTGTCDQLSHRQIRGEVSPPSVCQPGCPITANLEAVIMRAIAVNPAHRFSSTRELADAIAIASGEDAALRAASDPPWTFAELTAGPTRTWRPPREPPPDRVVETALGTGNPTEIAAEYLTRASGLIAHHQLRESAQQLQLAVDTLSLSEHPSAALWPVLLSLAAVQAGLGDRAMARRMAVEARDHAAHARALIGQQRAVALLRRLSGGGGGWGAASLAPP